MQEMRPLPSSNMSVHQLTQILEYDHGARFPPLSSFIDLAQTHLNCLLPEASKSRHYYRYLIKYFHTFCVAANNLSIEEEYIHHAQANDDDDDDEEEITFEQRKLARIKLGLHSDVIVETNDEKANEDDSDWEEVDNGVTGSNAGNKYTINDQQNDDEQRDPQNDDDEQSEKTVYL